MNYMDKQHKIKNNHIYKTRQFWAHQETQPSSKPGKSLESFKRTLGGNECLLFTTSAAIFLISNMAVSLQNTCCVLVLIFLVCGDATISVIKQEVRSPDGQPRRGIILAPQNTAALVGDTIVLTCEVDPPPPNARVTWQEHITFEQGSTISENEQVLAHPNRDRYSIIHATPNQFHLQIRDLRLSDGGRYACTDTLAAQPDLRRGEAQLIVLEQETNCTSTAPSDGIVVEKQNHTIECVVNFQGAFSPLMTWTGPGDFLVAGSVNPPSVWSGVAYTVNRDMANKRFECETNFTAPPFQPEGIADNAPIFSHIYRAPTIFVYWGPAGTYADPLRPVYYPGDTLTCYTDAYPEATYRWQNMRTLEEFIGPVFTFTADMVGTNQSMRCQVQNVILGFVYSDNIFVASLVAGTPTTTIPPTTPSTTAPPAISNCNDFSGLWRSDEPFAELFLQLDEESQIGEIYGLFMNRTDTVWVEVIGTVRKSDWSYIGLSAIWPLNDGVTGLSGECHRCHGVEVIIGEGMIRAVQQSSQCGTASTPRPYEPFRFRRIATKAEMLAQGPVSVHAPTIISKRLGVQLK